MKEQPAHFPEEPPFLMRPNATIMDIDQQMYTAGEGKYVPHPLSTSCSDVTFVPASHVARYLLKNVERTVGLLISDSHPFFKETVERIESVSDICFTHASRIPMKNLLEYYVERLGDLAQESIAHLRNKSL